MEEKTRRTTYLYNKHIEAVELLSKATDTSLLRCIGCALDEYLLGLGLIKERILPAFDKKQLDEALKGLRKNSKPNRRNK